jgi:predicted TPR repeat methyltransferase
MFIEIPQKLLRTIAVSTPLSSCERMPKLYYYPIGFVRKFFWLRLRCIYKSMMKNVKNWHACLDFGCGNGVFLPTLSSLFSSLKGIDIEMVEAPQIVDYYDLKNVQLIKSDIHTYEFVEKSFDVIIATDVLEHFKKLDRPVSQIYRWLKDDGMLFTSLPTENVFTKGARILGRFQKPWDHYHTGEAVESFLLQHGFCKIEMSIVIPICPLYLVGAWRKKL